MIEDDLIPLDKLVLVSIEEKGQAFADIGVEFEEGFDQDQIIPDGQLFEFAILNNEGTRIKPIRMIEGEKAFEVKDHKVVKIDYDRYYIRGIDRRVREILFSQEERKNGVALSKLISQNIENLNIQVNRKLAYEQVKDFNFKQCPGSKVYRSDELVPVKHAWKYQQILPEDLILVSISDYLERYKSYILYPNIFINQKFEGKVLPKGAIFEFAILNEKKTHCKLVRGFFTEQRVFDLKDVQAAKIWPNGFIESKNKVYHQYDLHGWKDYRIEKKYPNGLLFWKLNEYNNLLVERFYGQYLRQDAIIESKNVIKRKQKEKQEEMLKARKIISQGYNNF